MFGPSRRWAGHDAKSWPVLWLLLVVVLVPAVGVLWFMSQAMRNERLAMRQKLFDVYEGRLLGLQHELQLYWQARTTQLEVPDPQLAGSRTFAERVRGGLAGSVVVYGPDGRPSYPAPPRAPEVASQPSRDWRRAERLEHSGQAAAAATSYAEIAERAADHDLAARALLAQARCLARVEQTETALAILTGELSRPEYAGAADRQGRLIAPSALLRALQLIEDTSSPGFRRVAAALAERLEDYDDSALPATQRRFLMSQLAAVAPAAPAFDTLAAEELAQRYLDSDPPAPPTTSLQLSGLPEVWHLASPSGAVVALYEQDGLIRDLESLIASRGPQPGATVELLPPGIEPDDHFLVSLPAGGFLQDWQLALRPEDPTLFATAASQRIAAYLLIGVLVVVAIVILALAVARAVERQLKLTRLKNDLLSTVSHELKTPLASMRLLVDTLLDTGTDDPRRVREYLRLIAKENVRLSRLVENFLTFSRLERGRQSFDRKEISAASVAEAAAASVADRFRAAGCELEVQIPPDLPAVTADHDALVTVLINLLDNAYKYSGEEKHVVLHAYRANGDACFAVRDYGIGLSGRVAGKIFDRFYQVDQSLSRDRDGVGLGLAIVKLIVQAHGGSVDVDSRPGEGSTFTVRLPASAEERRQPQEST